MEHRAARRALISLPFLWDTTRQVEQGAACRRHEASEAYTTGASEAKSYCRLRVEHLLSFSLGTWSAVEVSAL